jgi:hypothetical protein
MVVVALSPILVAAQEQVLPNRIASDGGLSVSIAKNNYNAGEFVVINGTVANFTNPSVVTILVLDPKGRQVEVTESQISVQDHKNQFRYVFQAGLVRQFDPDYWMRDSGEYRVIVTYQPPSLVTPEIERVELHFNYNNATTTTTNNTNTNTTS